LDDFFEERYLAHPKKRDRSPAEHQMASIPDITTAAVQEKFRQGHEAWIACEEWQWKNGVKAPSFAEFIKDRTWQYPPRLSDDPDAKPEYPKVMM
jgi:hypothetical protein